MYSNKKNKKRKLLITGANGFIGSFLVEEAINSGFDVYAGVRKSSNREYLRNEHINFFDLDLENTENLKKKIKDIGGFDYVIHVAGMTKTCSTNGFDYVNFELSKNLIDSLIQTGVPLKYIQISSLAAYGPGDPKSLNAIKDSDTPKPISAYGKSKLKLENYIKSLDNFPYLIFRPTGVYGPREKDFYVMYKGIKQGFESYVGTKDQHLTFVYVKDLVGLLIEALNSDFEQKSYFVTDLKGYTAQQFNKAIKDELNKKTISIVVPKVIVKFLAWFNEKTSCLIFNKPSTLNTDKYKEISQKNWLCDSSDLVTDFDYNPKYDLKLGIKETISWYKNQNKL